MIDTEAREHHGRIWPSAQFVKQIAAPDDGLFVPPSVWSKCPELRRSSARFSGRCCILRRSSPHDLDKIISDMNATGYGLTFGLHTRIDSRVQDIVEQVHAGNVYVNRNQIGAVVGSQPFGGEGLSGTGPKAGGPAYPLRFAQSGDLEGPTVREMPGPTGETNRLRILPRPPFLCLGPGDEIARAQATAVRARGGRAEVVADITPEALTEREGIAGALWWGDKDTARAYGTALARRKGPILPLLTTEPRRFEVTHERHLCVDTTASGGNAELLAEASGA